MTRFSLGTIAALSLALIAACDSEEGPLNHPPVVADDTAVIDEDGVATVPVLDNDSDPDGDTLTLLSASATYASVAVSGRDLVITPQRNFGGTVEVIYSAHDGTTFTRGRVHVTDSVPWHAGVWFRADRVDLPGSSRGQAMPRVAECLVVAVAHAPSARERFRRRGRAEAVEIEREQR